MSRDSMRAAAIISVAAISGVVLAGCSAGPAVRFGLER